jgi:hypothetical protein
MIVITMVLFAEREEEFNIFINETTIVYNIINILLNNNNSLKMTKVVVVVVVILEKHSIRLIN